MVLSMLATPFIIKYSNRIVMKLVASEWMLQSLQMTTIARKSINANKHVIICGYGRCGQNLARMLEQRRHPLHGARPRPGPRAPGRRRRRLGGVRRRRAAAGLMAAGLARASAVVVTYLDVPRRR